jgi:hypothetical protein
MTERVNFFNFRMENGWGESNSVQNNKKTTHPVKHRTFSEKEIIEFSMLARRANFLYAAHDDELAEVLDDCLIHIEISLGEACDGSAIVKFGLV